MTWSVPDRFIMSILRGRFLEDLKYIFREYGDHPAIYREGKDKRPIFWLYDVSAQHSASEVAEWRAVLDSVRGTALDGVFLYAAPMPQTARLDERGVA
eukprot:symbB.v1.2.001963.t1/scaffold84.1/size341116/9